MEQQGSKKGAWIRVDRDTGKQSGTFAFMSGRGHTQRRADGIERKR
jgi:hypothetical protein